MNYQTIRALALLPLAVATVACGHAATPPTAPGAGVVTTAEAYPDGSTLKATAPTPLSPAGGMEVDDNDPDLIIENASSKFFDSLDMAYVFEVLDADNRVIYQSAPVGSGGDGRTSHEIGVVLQFDRAFTWRAYATYQGRRGPMSSTAGFRTFSRYGLSCAHLRNELAIVQCRRAQYGFMSVPERVEFLRRIAFDLNAASAEHAPYGVLVKTTGHNCFGYSCDVICSNTGMHRQWDVLTDEDGAQAPVWSRLGQIAVRPCDAVQ
jgi:hypothetical protein